MRQGEPGRGADDGALAHHRHPPVRLDPTLLASLPDRLRAAQRVFDRTGGLHAAALFTEDGELLDIREDVGRHNAVDKLVGRALQNGDLPSRGPCSWSRAGLPSSWPRRP
ncbi:Protein FdhD [Streptomyces sp. MBT84]|nr:Protein FdhD [Streptomyces sp. MBT84]